MKKLNFQIDDKWADRKDKLPENPRTGRAWTHEELHILGILCAELQEMAKDILEGEND